MLNRILLYIDQCQIGGNYESLLCLCIKVIPLKVHVQMRTLAAYLPRIPGSDPVAFVLRSTTHIFSISIHDVKMPAYLVLINVYI